MGRPKKLKVILCGGCWNTGEEEYVPFGMPAQHYCYRPCSICKGETKLHDLKKPRVILCKDYLEAENEKG